MDTTDTYIKMCEKAEDIQRLIPEPDEHDWYSDNGSVWLPRQDQLQEMLQPCGFAVLIWDFRELAMELIKDNNYTSMEQLWLAFAMKEKYNQIWNKDSWIST